jgi:glutaconate CoA-transferase, subunit A
LAARPEDLAASIPDGAFLALPPDYSLVAMEVVRALIRKKAKGLRLLGVPILGLSADLLIGAGCVAEVETSAVSLGEAGLAPRFTEAVEKGLLKVKDATCPAIHTGLQASEKGVAFMPIAGIAGSDLVKERSDWKVQGDLDGAGDPPRRLAVPRALGRRGRQCLGWTAARARHGRACFENQPGFF